jgi:hypothetical protein
MIPLSFIPKKTLDHKSAFGFEDAFGDFYFGGEGAWLLGMM